jgi:hypothetical protein
MNRASFILAILLGIYTEFELGRQYWGSHEPWAWPALLMLPLFLVSYLIGAGPLSRKSAGASTDSAQISKTRDAVPLSLMFGVLIALDLVMYSSAIEKRCNDRQTRLDQALQALTQSQQINQNMVETSKKLSNQLAQEKENEFLHKTHNQAVDSH